MQYLMPGCAAAALFAATVAYAQTTSMIGMVEHLIAWFRPNGPMSVKEIATLYADLAVAMATTPAAAKTSRKAA